MNPADYEEGKLTMISRPEITPAELAGARHRYFDFGTSNGTDKDPWTIKTDGGGGLTDGPEARLGGTDQGLGRNLAPEERRRQPHWRWTASGGWSHPVHIHFEEGQILSRDGLPPPVWERWSAQGHLQYRAPRERRSPGRASLRGLPRHLHGALPQHPA